MFALYFNISAFVLLLQLGMNSESSFIKDQALSISFEPNKAPKLNLD